MYGGIYIATSTIYLISLSVSWSKEREETINSTSERVKSVNNFCFSVIGFVSFKRPFSRRKIILLEEKDRCLSRRQLNDHFQAPVRAVSNILKTQIRFCLLQTVIYCFSLEFLKMMKHILRFGLNEHDKLKQTYVATK